MDKELQVVGFQEKEAKVYMAALELGKGTVQQIAQKADLKRPTTYFIIEGLMKRGVVSSFYEGKKQFFIAENPEVLVDLFKQEKKDLAKREEQFNKLLPQLRSINNRQKDKPVVKYYEGKEGILSMVSEHARMSHDQEVYSAYSRDLIDKFLSPKELSSITNERLSHNLNVKALYTHSKGDLELLPKTERIRLSEDEFPVSCDIAFYEDRVRIASLKGRFVGVVIEDKEIAKSLRAIFQLAWKWVESQRKK